MDSVLWNKFGAVLRHMALWVVLALGSAQFAAASHIHHANDHGHDHHHYHHHHNQDPEQERSTCDYCLVVTADDEDGVSCLSIDGDDVGLDVSASHPSVLRPAINPDAIDYFDRKRRRRTVQGARAPPFA